MIMTVALETDRSVNKQILHKLCTIDTMKTHHLVVMKIEKMSSDQKYIVNSLIIR